MLSCYHSANSVQTTLILWVLNYLIQCSLNTQAHVYSVDYSSTRMLSNCMRWAGANSSSMWINSVICNVTGRGLMNTVMNIWILWKAWNLLTLKDCKFLKKNYAPCSYCCTYLFWNLQTWNKWRKLLKILTLKICTEYTSWCHFVCWRTVDSLTILSSAGRYFILNNNISNACLHTDLGLLIQMGWQRVKVVRAVCRLLKLLDRTPVWHWDSPCHL